MPSQYDRDRERQRKAEYRAKKKAEGFKSPDELVYRDEPVEPFKLAARVNATVGVPAAEVSTESQEDAGAPPLLPSVELPEENYESRAYRRQAFIDKRKAEARAYGESLKRRYPHEDIEERVKRAESYARWELGGKR